MNIKAVVTRMQASELEALGYTLQSYFKVEEYYGFIEESMLERKLQEPFKVSLWLNNDSIGTDSYMITVKCLDNHTSARLSRKSLEAVHPDTVKLCLLQVIQKLLYDLELYLVFNNLVQ